MLLPVAALALIQVMIQGPEVSPLVSGYLERLCHKLEPGVGGNVTAVSVTVDKAARADALPDAIVVTTGMIAGAQNEAELAGILAHEIAHYRSHEVCLRFGGHENPEAKQLEHEADQAAIRMLGKAGYDPIAMLRYFSVIRHARPDLPMAFSAEDILIERLQLEATDHPMKDSLVDTAEFRQVQDRVK
jgi:predicted Zn-dependent protease